MNQFDLIVIGAGSGLEVSAAAAQHGWKVAVIDEGPFNGTCSTAAASLRMGEHNDATHQSHV